MRILLVEDEVGIASFVKKIFELENFSVDIAADGVTASFLVQTNKYNLIILDRKIPLKDGKKVCVEIRETNKKIPIIILSAVNELKEKIDILNCGANDYIEKPFKPEELLYKVSTLLKKHPGNFE